MDSYLCGLLITWVLLLHKWVYSELCCLTKKLLLSAITGICTDVSRLNVQGAVTLLSVIQ
jgi:hypothetical protein